MLNLVRQKEDGQCLVACVAMVLEKSLETVLSEVTLTVAKKDGVKYLRDDHAVEYLAKHGYCYGLRIAPGKLNDSVTEFNVLVDITQCPAILAVRSKRHEDWLHAVVWCNKRRCILDPQEDEPQSLTNYEILEWVPISNL